jgi:SAM-dependent methyltransferase
MAARDIDPNSFHDFELAGWQRASADYHRYFGSLTMQTIGPLLDAVSTGTSVKLLDLATGPGYVAAEARRRGDSPMGIDFSQPMVDLARSLHPGIDFQLGDAESLTLRDSEFGAVVMNFGMLHLARPEAAIREAHRVLRAGGSFAFSVWAKPEEALGFAIVLRAVEEFADPNVWLPPGPPFFRFSDRVESARVLGAAGFRDTRVAQIPLIWKLESPSDFFEAFYRGSARTGGLLRAQTPQGLHKVREAVESRVALYLRDGRLEIPMPALVVSGHKA